jgi:hypothetical protein
VGIRDEMAEDKYLEVYAAFRIINMSLLLCAMVGLSRTSYNETGNCNDSSYQL